MRFPAAISLAFAPGSDRCFTGELWAGDVGLEVWELVRRVKPGDNYGWSLVEASNPIQSD